MRPSPCLFKGKFIFCCLVLATVHLLNDFEMSDLEYIGPFWQTDARTDRQHDGQTHICRVQKQYPSAGCRPNRGG